ncbi:MAG: class B sortase [Tissierellia bacterium]|nr:class B sortase [Tissierellia bacterium]
MEILGRSSRFLSRLFDYLVGLLIILIILYSSFSLYSSYMLYRGAYVSDKLLSLKPEPSQGPVEKPTFEGLKSINEDVIAWITVDNTNIDHPVLQGENNFEYVNKDVYGNFAFEGAIFLDTRNKPNFEDGYSLLYGHHMEHGAMFGDLQLFLEKDFFEKNKTGSLITEEATYHIDFFAVIQADGYDQKVFDPTHVVDSKSKKEFLAYIEEKKVHSRKIDMSEDEKLIGLSTCTSVQTNGRTILYGVLRKEP